MYLFDNELFAIECVAKYAIEGRVVDSSNGQFAHCPEPRPKGQKHRLPGDRGYWLTFNDHQHQGLLQSVDVGRKCYFTPDVLKYLDTWPSGFFELYDIYDKFNKPTPETRKKLSVARRRRKSWYHLRPGRKHPLSGVPITEETKKKISETLSGRTGALSPMYGRTGSLSNRSKAIIAIKPDGTELYYDSILEAARDLEIKHHTLGNYLKNGHIPTRSEFKNWQFFYAAKSNKKAG
jgi:hypothetical protein